MATVLRNHGREKERERGSGSGWRRKKGWEEGTAARNYLKMVAIVLNNVVT